MILLRILWCLFKGVVSGKCYYFDVCVFGCDVLKECFLCRERVVFLCEQGGLLFNLWIGDVFWFWVFVGVNFQYFVDVFCVLFLQQLIEFQVVVVKVGIGVVVECDNVVLQVRLIYIFDVFIQWDDVVWQVVLFGGGGDYQYIFICVGFLVVDLWIFIYGSFVFQFVEDCFCFFCDQQ